MIALQREWGTVLLSHISCSRNSAERRAGKSEVLAHCPSVDKLAAAAPGHHWRQQADELDSKGQGDSAAAIASHRCLNPHEPRAHPGHESQKTSSPEHAAPLTPLSSRRSGAGGDATRDRVAKQRPPSRPASTQIPLARLALLEAGLGLPLGMTSFGVALRDFLGNSRNDPIFSEVGFSAVMTPAKEAASSSVPRSALRAWLVIALGEHVSQKLPDAVAGVEAILEDDVVPSFEHEARRLATLGAPQAAQPIGNHSHHLSSLPTAASSPTGPSAAGT